MSIWFKDLRQLARAALMEAAAASTNPSRIRAARDKVSNGYTGPVILAEGDSWFCYPKRVGPHQINDAPSDLIAQLSERYAVFTQAKPGDVAITMRGFINEENGLLAEIGRVNADILLLSAGGNDLLGDGRLKRYLEAGDREIPEYTRTTPYSNTFWAAVDAIEVMIRQSLRQHPQLQVIVHGYDYAIPTGEGPWLQEPMDALGIPRAKHADITRRITDQFNRALSELTQAINTDLQAERVHFVDLRNTISDPEHWRDELHPTSEGFAALAGRIADRIEAVSSSR